MNNTEIVSNVRRVGQISPNDPVYNATEILAEGTQALRDRFASALQQTRQGYWLHDAVTETNGIRNFYKIPANTLVQGLEKLEIANPDTSDYRELQILTQPQATPWVRLPSGSPTHFTLEADQIRLWPGPDGEYSLRFVFYLQPPELIAMQSCRVVSTTSTTVVVDTNPATLTVPITTSTGFYIQNYNGSHEIPCFDGVVASITGAGPYTINVSGSYTGGSRIQVGDYVTPAGYSVFPMLPVELHRPLCDYVSGAIWASKGDKDKAIILSQKADSGINRFVEMAVHRVKSKPFTWIRKDSYLRQRYGWGR